jgi:hypothetical protein
MVVAARRGLPVVRPAGRVDSGSALPDHRRAGHLCPEGEPDEGMDRISVRRRLYPCAGCHVRQPHQRSWRPGWAGECSRWDRLGICVGAKHLRQRCDGNHARGCERSCRALVVLEAAPVMHAERLRRRWLGALRVGQQRLLHLEAARRTRARNEENTEDTISTLGSEGGGDTHFPLASTWAACSTTSWERTSRSMSASANLDCGRRGWL